MVFPHYPSICCLNKGFFFFFNSDSLIAINPVKKSSILGSISKDIWRSSTRWVAILSEQRLSRRSSRGFISVVWTMARWIIKHYQTLNGLLGYRKFSVFLSGGKSIFAFACFLRNRTIILKVGFKMGACKYRNP